MKPEDKIKTSVDITRRYANSMCLYLSISHDPPEVMDKIISDMMYEMINGQANAWFTRAVPAKSEMINKCNEEIYRIINHYVFCHDQKTDDPNSGSVNFVTSICAVEKARGSIGHTKNIYDFIRMESLKLRAGEKLGGNHSEFSRAIHNDVIFNSLF
jgi:hypothetical protein